VPRPIPALVFLARGALIALIGVAANARAADLVATLPIERVTVYRAGAAVTRRGLVEIPAGTHQLVVRGLPAGIETSALRVAVESGAVRLGAIEVTHVNEAQLASESERALQQQLEDATDRRQALADEVTTAQTQLKLLDSLAANPAGSPTHASVDGANLAGVLQTMSTTSEAAHRRVREGSARLRAADREIAKLRADLAKVATQRRQSTEVRTTLEASAAANAAVSVTYMVADAGWGWIYEARLDTKEKRVTIDRQGEVRQGSGEDWNHVALTLTTSRPSSDAATPEVSPLFLNLAELERGARDRLAAPAAMDLRAGGQVAAVEEVVVTAARRQYAVAEATEYVADYVVPGTATVRADREPRLFPIANEQFAVELVARIVPEAGRAAHLEATFRYERDVPLDAGELQLYRDGAFVGVAAGRAFLPGAEVRVPFGVDERIRVEVHNEPSQSTQRGLISRQTVKETRRRIDITNFHPLPIVVEVVDQVPVSRHTDIRVEIPKGATEPTTKDLDGKAGVWLWKLTAPPQTPVAIRHYVSVQYPRDRELALESEPATGS